MVSIGIYPIRMWSLMGRGHVELEPGLLWSPKVASCTRSRVKIDLDGDIWSSLVKVTDAYTVQRATDDGI